MPSIPADAGQAAPVAQPGSQKKKKKGEKNDPARPQPAWMFPPEEENPVLNPKPKSAKEKEQDTKDRLNAIDFLNHRAVGAPHKPGPPPQLLALVGAFLASYNFESTGRVFTAERLARVRLNGWEDQVGENKLPKKFPDLVRIYKEWYATAKPDIEMEDGANSDAEATSSDAKSSNDSASGNSSGSESDDESDVSSASSMKAPKKKTKPIKKRSSKQASENDNSSSDSDSESLAKPGLGRAQAVATAKNPTVNGLVGKLKEKAKHQASSSDSKKDSATKPKVKKVTPDPEASAIPISITTKAKSSSKKPKVNEVLPEVNVTSISEATESKTSTKKAMKTSDSDSSSSASSSSDSDEGLVPQSAKKDGFSKKSQAQDSDKFDTEKPVTSNGATKNGVQNSKSSTSDATDSDSSDSIAQAAPKGEVAAVKVLDMPKRKRDLSSKVSESATPNKVPKKNNAPFQRIPSDTKVDPRFSSNAYQSYDYADRAYKDLSVTKGKGFTKEKNKKKRGSYRGGVIDIAGGKGVKFDD